MRLILIHNLIHFADICGTSDGNVGTRDYVKRDQYKCVLDYQLAELQMIRKNHDIDKTTTRIFRLSPKLPTPRSLDDQETLVIHGASKVPESYKSYRGHHVSPKLLFDRRIQYFDV